nr:transposase [Neglectibacter sp. M00184]
MQALEQRFPSITVDKYVIMPNHIHFLLQIRREAGEASSSPTVPNVIGAYKSLTTRVCGQDANLFQRSFHDHVIRNEKEYQKIWKYIDENPIKWTMDCFYQEDQ